MDSIDTNLLVLITVVAFAIWVLVTIWRYVSIQSQKGLLEQEQDVFGHELRPEDRKFMATVVPRFGSSLGFLAAIVAIALLGVAKVLGYL